MLHDLIFDKSLTDVSFISPDGSVNCDSAAMYFVWKFDA